MPEELVQAEDAPSAAAHQAQRDRALRRLLPLLLIVATFAVYARTFTFDFVYDDYAQIVETKQLNTWRMVPRYFTGHVWAWKSPGEKGPYYRPIFMLWLLVNQTLFGQSAGWWHFTNVVIHTLATLLLYALVTRLSGDRLVGAFTALFFGLHPAHLESVAWISGVTDPLLAVFFLGSWLAFITPGRIWQAASLALFALALLEKETALILPALLFAQVWLFTEGPVRAQWGRRFANAFARVLPFAMVTLVYLAIRLKVMGGLSMTITPVPLRQMVYTWPSMLVFYLRHLVWPAGLSVFYSLPRVSAPDFANFWLPCLILMGVALGFAAWAMRSRLAALAVLIIFLPIAPVLNLRTFARVELVHDRYLYLPVIGISLLAALAIRRLGRPSAEWTAALLIACALGYGTLDQGKYWENNLTLFERGVTVAPENEIANQCLGTTLLMRAQMAEAIPYYKHALELNPDMFEASYSLGRAYFELGMYEEAEPYFERAMMLNVRSPMPILYYGLSKFRQGQLPLAELAMRRAVRMKGPDDYREYHLSLGMVLEQKGDWNGALAEYQAEAAENPDPSKALEAMSRIKEKMAASR
jgi:tetratricopeptide (TPR) repeat protein